MSETPKSPWQDLETYVTIPRLVGLTLSHDGSTLIAAVQGPDAEKTAYTTSLWAVDPAGERRAVRRTRSVKGEAASAFLRDGSLVFTSKRDVPAVGEDKPKDSTNALWCLPSDGGEAYVLARRDGGYGSILTNADDDNVVLGVLMFDGAADDEADAAKREQRSKRKVSAILHDGYPVRYWDHDLGPEHPRLRLAPVEGDVVGDLTLGGPRDLTGDVGAALGDAALSRGGQTLVAEWKRSAAHGVTVSEVVRIDLATGERTVIAAEDGVEFGSPVVSDDGRLVAVVRSLDSTPTKAVDSKLWLVDLATGESRFVAEGWDRWGHPVAFSPDASTLYVVADEDGAAPVFAVDVATGGVRRLTEEGAHHNVLRSPDGSTLYALRSSYSNPGDIVAIDVDTATTRVLRSPVAYPELPGRVERVETTAADGTRVPGWLIVPDGTTDEAPAPLTLWVHGGPLGSWNAWSWRWCPWLLVARGQAVLLPDPALSTGYGLDYIQRGWGRWGAEPFTDIMALTDAVEARPDIRDDASVMMGGSFGGYMANWIATHTDRFKGIVSHASLWNLTAFGPSTDAAWYWSRELSPEMLEANSPHRFAGDIVTPMLVIHGDLDYRVPISEGLALWWSLNEKFDGDPAEFPHRFLYFPDENHWILTPQHAVVWYETVLGFADAVREGRLLERPAIL
nr:prolyl oligopeptidase family serine peptidase [Tessaracoccus bendigoensis]